MLSQKCKLKDASEQTHANLKVGHNDLSHISFQEVKAIYENCT